MELENNVRIPDRMFFKIGEVAKIAGLKPYVLRFWETEFKFLAPNKSAKKQRMYSRLDVENVLLVKHLLYVQKLTIEGARQRVSQMRKQGDLFKERKPNLSVPVEKQEKIFKALEIAKELAQLSQLSQ